MQIAMKSLGVFVVSMPGATQRRAHMQAELGKQGIGFTFFDALNGEQAQQALNAWGLAVAPGALSPGELGCAFSHISLWRQLLESSAQSMVVLEDDVFLGQGAARFLQGSDWLPDPASQQLIKIEKYQDAVLLGQPQGAALDGRRLHPLKSDHWGTAGYVLGREAARQLLALLAQQSLNQAIDHFMFDRYRQTAPQSVWQLNPAICIQEVVHAEKMGLGSDLAFARAQRMAAAKLPISRAARHLRLLSGAYWRAKFNKWRFRTELDYR